MSTNSGGYSGTPLWKKLGLKEGLSTQLIDPPEELEGMLDGALDAVQVVDGHAEMVLFFTNKHEGFKQHLKILQDNIRRDGAIWVCWFKKASGKPSELSEDIIRKTALSMDLVDVKVCAVNSEWSGLKLMIRKELR